MVAEWIGVLGKEVQVKEIKIMKMGHRDPEFAKINPNMKLPALKDGELVLFESGAIMRYLCDKFASSDNELYPRNNLVRKA